jgi:hypothetical protein
MIYYLFPKYCIIYKNCTYNVGRFTCSPGAIVKNEQHHRRSIVLRFLSVLQVSFSATVDNDWQNDDPLLYKFPLGTRCNSMIHMSKFIQEFCHIRIFFLNFFYTANYSSRYFSSNRNKSFINQWIIVKHKNKVNRSLC